MKPENYTKMNIQMKINAMTLTLPNLSALICKCSKFARLKVLYAYYAQVKKKTLELLDE